MIRILRSALREYLSRTGFRFQIIVLVSTAICCVALLSSLVISLQVQSRLREFFVSQGEHAVENLASQSQLVFLFASPENAQRISEIALNYPDVQRILFTDDKFNLIHAQERKGTESIEIPLQKEPIRRTKLTGETAEAWRFGTPVINERKDSPFDVNVPVASTLGYIYIDVSKRSMQTLTWALLLGSGLVMVVVAAIVLFLVSLLTRQLIKPLNNLGQAMLDARRGQSGVRSTPSGPRDLREMALVFNKMMDALEQREGDLERKVVERTLALEHARDEAVKSNEERRKLIQTVNNAIEEERKSIAVEIHDHLNAELIGMRLHIQRIVTLSDRLQGGELTGKIQDTARSVLATTSDLYTLARRIVKRLRPEIIDTMGLRDAVEEVIRHYDSLNERTSFSYDATGDFSQVDTGVAITVYRLVQEALSNIFKHAEATMVTVQLNAIEENRTLYVSIVDNGKGFDADTTSSGIGLIGMRERVLGVNGAMSIESAPGEGTSIHFWMPVSLAIVGAPALVAQPVES